MSAAMVTAWLASGPWNPSLPFHHQPQSFTGLMIIYWVAYYTTLAVVFASFGISAITSVVTTGLRTAYMLVPAALGALLAIAWAAACLMTVAMDLHQGR